jgi:hypothetical protein
LRDNDQGSNVAARNLRQMVAQKQCDIQDLAMSANKDD